MIGDRDVVVLDPGPDVDSHVRAILLAVEAADRVSIVLTHHHGDHSAAVPRLLERLDARVFGPPAPPVTDPLADGGTVDTDVGTLVAVHTPGHTRDHLCYHWPEARALFAGDLLLGSGSTTWVADYPGCVADYLASLDRVRSLAVDVIYPTHGPALTDPGEAVDRFEAHRRTRIEQVADALARAPDAVAQDLLEEVYGSALPEGMRSAALLSLDALVNYVRAAYPRESPRGGGAVEGV